MMNGSGKSDRRVVPKKPPNKTGSPAAEEAEGRRLAKGNPREQTMRRTLGRIRMQHALKWIRQAAASDKSMRFTALMHHIYNTDTLREAYFGLKRNAASGVDGETWQHYGENLEENLQALAGRLKRGAYRAKPARRVFIPKPDGRQRPLGIVALEDKLVQRATVLVLNCIYEVDFLGFSYGFRPERNQHNALDALYTGVLTKRVNHVLDADVSGFFDAIDRKWLVKFIEHRIGDRRVVRLIQKWLNAGVLEDGKRIFSDKGTVQGGSISPLLANVYLHYVFDLWVHNWRTKWASGDVIVVRFADDFIVGFQRRGDVKQFHEALRERFAKFGLKLHPDKTRSLEFGPYAAINRRKTGQGKPETFDFLGFTHICARKKSNGRFTVLRQTITKRLRAKLKKVKAELRRRMHLPIPEQGKWLRSVVLGHLRYYGVPMNLEALRTFRFQVVRLWWRTLRRRGQKNRMTWKRMRRHMNRWIPPVRLYHPYPLRRFGVITRGRSPVR